MPLFSSYVLILQIREGTTDIYISGFSDYMGIVEMILKNANRGGSRRKGLLSKGTLISAQVYQRNRLYLSDFSIIDRYYLKFKTIKELDIFDTILMVLRRGLMEPDYKLFKYVITSLKKATTKDALVTLLISLTQYLGIIDWEQFRCQQCNNIGLKGVTDYNGTTVCASCVVQSDDGYDNPYIKEFNLATYDNLITYIRETIGYNTDNMLFKLTKLIHNYGKNTRN